MSDLPAANLTPAGRVILISGASRGIGFAIARRLLDEGYFLSLGVRNPELLKKSFAPDDRRLHVARFDALDPNSAKVWVEAAVERFGRIDGLINNAGILRQIGFSDTGEEALDELWAVNVKAPFRLTRLCLPQLRKTGQGRIINIASTDGKRYRNATVSVGYAMTKHALVAMSHAARFDSWDYGVRVTALCPGAVATDLIAGVPGVTPSAERMDPDTIARTVSFLLTLPNTASVAEMPLNTRLESTL